MKGKKGKKVIQGIKGKQGKTDQKLFRQISSLSTEQRNPRSRNIDTKTVSGILSVINAEDQLVAKAVKDEIPYIRKAVELVATALGNGGRLIYVGAGTSGRLGVVDASECPPTFGTNPDQIIGIMAGGKSAVFRSKEGVEDRVEAAVSDLQKARVGAKDVVCGIAASARTPYVNSAIKEAKRKKAKTIFVTTNPRSIVNSMPGLLKIVDVAICPVVGPEVIMGSTRMKSGTAQKMVLNMITTAAMIRLGKVYENMMVDLRMNSKKLEERAKRVLMTATGINYEEAVETLALADGHVKTAIVMVQKGVSARRARALLKKHKGFVRQAL
ncbi:MAG TPA: N-acetylmuramic acid 6-phosphate etherase [Bacteroidota bacterium]|nr:N-acetylmuramic acid 6-phosphate etherase [Bacteroidota bacterium]